MQQTLVWLIDQFWGAFVIMGCLMGVLALVKKCWHKELSRWHEFFFYGTCALLFTVIVWVVKYDFKKAIQSVNSVSVQTKPDLRCEIMQADCGLTKYKEPFEVEAKNVTGIIFWARIKNRGSPSSVWKWRLKARLVSGVPVETDKLQTPVLVFPSAPGQPATTLDSGQYLAWNLMDSPLTIGASKTGWIAFSFDATLFDELKRPGVKLFLEFDDTDGRTISTEYTPAMNWAHESK